MKIKIKDQIIDINKDMNYLELSKQYEKDFKYPIIAVKENDKYVSMWDKVKNNSVIDFFDLSDRNTNRIYQDSLIYILIYSSISLYGEDVMVNVKHSIDKGLYIELNKEIKEEAIKELEKRMNIIIKANLPIRKKRVYRLDAIKYFEAKKLLNKARMLRYLTDELITVYRLDDMYDIYFSELVPKTGLIQRFKLHYLHDRGFVLMYPTNYNPDVINDYVHHPQLFLEFQENAKRARKMHIERACDINDLVVIRKIKDLIRTEETLQSSRLLSIAEEIHQRADKLKIILIAGPSSSGKTTSSLKLSNYLRSFGINPVRISMDDYFLPRNKTPIRADGHYDYDNITAMDLELFNTQIKDILDGKEVLTPIYNFITGEPAFSKKIKMHKDDVLIIEGIHALNPVILSNIDSSEKYKLYISPATTINIDNHNRIPTTDNRFIRRLVRDSRTRGKNIEGSLDDWARVREGEEEFVFPYQDEANKTFNTAYFYELGVLRVYAEPLLYRVKEDSPYYEEAQRLINLLENFLAIPDDAIPDDSLIREFIGGSCYNVD